MKKNIEKIQNNRPILQNEPHAENAILVEVKSMEDSYPLKLKNFTQRDLPLKFESIFYELRKRKYLSKGFVDEAFTSIEREIA